MFQAEESDDSNKEAEDDIDTGLAERLGVTSPIGKKRQKASKAGIKSASNNSAKRREDKGKPKFGCSLAWAQDTSPIVAPSPNTPGPKGKVMLGSANELCCLVQQHKPGQASHRWFAHWWAAWIPRVAHMWP